MVELGLSGYSHLSLKPSGLTIYLDVRALVPKLWSDLYSVLTGQTELGWLRRPFQVMTAEAGGRGRPAGNRVAWMP